MPARFLFSFLCAVLLLAHFLPSEASAVTEEEVREVAHPSEALRGGLRAADLAAARRACVEINQ